MIRPSIQTPARIRKSPPAETAARLTLRQRQFLKCLEAEKYNMNRAMMLCHIKDWLMDRWFRDPLFISTLKTRYRQVEFRTHLELTYHLPLAAMNLVNMTNGFDTETMVRACSNLLRFHNNSRSFREYALQIEDRPMPSSAHRRKTRIRFTAASAVKNPALDLSRSSLEESEADLYKQRLQYFQELNRQRHARNLPPFQFPFQEFDSPSSPKEE
jgi:hypothetical protein